MRNLTNEMKKNVLRITAGTMTAITLAAAPLTVSAATRTNTPEAAITTQVSESSLTIRNIPILFSEGTTSNGRAVTTASVQGYRAPRLIVNEGSATTRNASFFLHNVSFFLHNSFFLH